MSNPIRGGLRKVRRATFVQVPSATIRDEDLSYRARGVLAFLLDHPDGFDVRAGYIASKGREGRDAIEAALRELRAAGYYRLERRRLPDGTYAMGTAIAEEPVAEWAEAHQRHDGRAVPCRVTAAGDVVELEPADAAEEPPPVTGFQGPEERGPEDRLPVDRSLDTDRDTDREGGEELADVDEDLPAVPHPETPPARTCPRWPSPHGACGACADDRRRVAAWEDAVVEHARQQGAAAAALGRLVRAEARALRDAELDSCRLCDEAGTATLVVDGQPASTVCLHDAGANERAVRGRREARATLSARKPATYSPEA